MHWQSRLAMCACGSRIPGSGSTGPLGTYRRCRLGDFRIVCDSRDDALRVVLVRIGNRRKGDR